MSVVALAVALVLLMRGGAPAAKVPQLPAVATPAPAAQPAPAPPARGGKARTICRTVTLPVDSPWALPPMLVLQSRTGGRSDGRPAAARSAPRSTWRCRPPRAEACARGAASAGALKLLAAFPRTGGPLLVLSVNGRHIRAQETTLWMTRTALRRVRRDAREAPAQATAARARRERPRRPGRPAARQAGRAEDARRHLPQRGLSLRHRLARAGRDQPRGDELRPEHARLERRRGRLDAVPALDLAPLGRRCAPATASPIRTTRRMRSSARRATSTPRTGEQDIRRAVFAYNHADWYVNDVLSIAAAIPADFGA